MLGRLEGISGARALRRQGSGSGRRLATGLALAGALFALCWAGTAPTAFAMGMALFAAALAAGLSALGPLAGCAAGALAGGLRPFHPAALIGAGAILAGDALWTWTEAPLRRALDRSARALLQTDWLPGGLRRLLARRRAPSMLARSPNRVRCAALAGLGALIPGLTAAAQPVQIFQALASAAAACAASPLLLDGLGVRWGRRCLTGEERLGLTLMAASLLAGVTRIWPLLALALGGAVTMGAGSCGALCGTALGTAAALACGNARILAMLACGGAVVQLNSRGREALGGLAMAAAGALLGAPWAWLVGAGASAAVYEALPGRVKRSLATWFSREEVPPERLALYVQEETRRRLRALGAAFGELSEGYERCAPPPDPQALTRRLREALCEDCPGFRDCWTERGGGARFLCALIEQAEALEEPPEETPPGLRQLCRRAGPLPEAARTLLEDYALARRTGRERGAENRRAGERFGLARRLLEEAAGAGFRFSPERSRKAGAALERAGVPASRTAVMRMESEAVIAGPVPGGWTGEKIRRAEAAVAGALSWPAARASARGGELVITRLPRLRVSAGTACAACREGEPSGDSFALKRLPGGRLLALICDGMGSGADAARESAEAVRLMLRFMGAGAGAGLAVEAVNALLASRQAGDMFATVDLLTLDLETGEAELTKLAACPTLLMRRSEAHWASGGRLPLGILEAVEPACLRAKLLPGDVLVMASDGVMDALDSGTLAGLVRGHRGGMRELAGAILAAAGDPVCRDDRTVLCLRVEVCRRR